MRQAAFSAVTIHALSLKPNFSSIIALFKLPADSGLCAAFSPPFALGLLSPDEVGQAARLLVDSFLPLNQFDGPDREDTSQAPWLGLTSPQQLEGEAAYLPLEAAAAASAEKASQAREERQRLAAKGLEWRLGPRLLEPDLHLSMESSLFLVVQDTHDGTFVAAAELGLRPTDGRLPAEFAVPPLFAVHSSQALGAYLCNFVVRRDFRRRGLGARLLETCEQLVLHDWQLDKLYLHVDVNNVAALSLYEGAGYKALPRYDSVARASSVMQSRLQPNGRPALNRYYVKRL